MRDRLTYIREICFHEVLRIEFAIHQTVHTGCDDQSDVTTGPIHFQKTLSSAQECGLVLLYIRGCNGPCAIRTGPGWKNHDKRSVGPYFWMRQVTRNRYLHKRDTAMRTTKLVFRCRLNVHVSCRGRLHTRWQMCNTLQLFVQETYQMEFRLTTLESNFKPVIFQASSNINVTNQSTPVQYQLRSAEDYRATAEWLAFKSKLHSAHNWAATQAGNLFLTWNKWHSGHGHVLFFTLSPSHKFHASLESFRFSERKCQNQVRKRHYAYTALQAARAETQNSDQGNVQSGAAPALHLAAQIQSQVWFFTDKIFSLQLLHQGPVRTTHAFASSNVVVQKNMHLHHIFVHIHEQAASTEFTVDIRTSQAPTKWWLPDQETTAYLCTCLWFGQLLLS